MNLPKDCKILSPKGASAMRAYFDLRWKILQAPWNQPRTSTEQDDEDDCLHYIARLNEEIVGVGRLQFNSSQEGQIRFMGISDDHQVKGIGCAIINKIESDAKTNGLTSIVLNSRENAVEFYEKMGYENMGETYLLWGKIPHFRMQKSI
ncbi:MAG: GNAT family N-acetyltransferase [Bacteroidetes bacterium]|nr:GNAT family N-acetyltransferase [Bacteroidota bacterium]